MQAGKKLCFTFPAHSIIILDECQRIYRNRSSTSKVPDHVAAFETHRHEGLNFWLITQRPALVDAYVRGLVGRHIHIRNGWLGRKLFEWPEASDVDSRQARQLAASSKYKLPKKVFELYKSATAHTQTKQRTPFYINLFVLALLGFFGCAYYVYNKIDTKVSLP